MRREEALGERLIQEFLLSFTYAERGFVIMKWHCVRQPLFSGLIHCKFNSEFLSENLEGRDTGEDVGCVFFDESGGANSMP